MTDELKVLQQKSDRQLAEIISLKAILSPFAEAAKAWPDYARDDLLIAPFSIPKVTVGDLRRALAALESTP